MSKKSLAWGVFAIAVVAFGVIQFIPSPAVIIPAKIPVEQRAAHRVINFEGIPNFRDLGGYETIDGQRVKWGVLYRSATFANSSRSDLAALESLGLVQLIDFRSSGEKEEEPNQLPEAPSFEVIEIPILDEGNKAVVEDIKRRIEEDDFDDFDPDRFMTEANIQFGTEFTPEFRKFIRSVQLANGKPVVWHCSAGKDRTGFASAILLRILGVPMDTVMADYMASGNLILEARSNQLRLIRLFGGEEAEQKMSVMMSVKEAWLRAAFEAIDQQWGSFDNYVTDGLHLSADDIATLRANLLDG